MFSATCHLAPLPRPGKIPLSPEQVGWAAMTCNSGQTEQQELDHPVFAPPTSLALPAPRPLTWVIQ